MEEANAVQPHRLAQEQNAPEQGIQHQGRGRTQGEGLREKSEKQSPNEPQEYWLFVGLLLIAYVPQGQLKGIHNGQLFEVTSIGEIVGLVDFESKEDVELPLEFVRDYLRLAYAFTNVGCQGRSLGNLAGDGVLERGLTLWDTESPYFTRAHLFTGTSRCRSGSILQVV